VFFSTVRFSACSLLFAQMHECKYLFVVIGCCQGQGYPPSLQVPGSVSLCLSIALQTVVSKFCVVEALLAKSFGCTRYLYNSCFASCPWSPLATLRLQPDCLFVAPGFSDVSPDLVMRRPHCCSCACDFLSWRRLGLDPGPLAVSLHLLNAVLSDSISTVLPSRSVC